MLAVCVLCVVQESSTSFALAFNAYSPPDSNRAQMHKACNFQQWRRSTRTAKYIIELNRPRAYFGADILRTGFDVQSLCFSER